MAPGAIVFDFNGTLSNDEPVLAHVYQELFAELGRPLTEAEYYEQLAGHTDEEMLIRWFGRPCPVHDWGSIFCSRYHPWSPFCVPIPSRSEFSSGPLTRRL